MLRKEPDACFLFMNSFIKIIIILLLLHILLLDFNEHLVLKFNKVILTSLYSYPEFFPTGMWCFLTKLTVREFQVSTKLLLLVIFYQVFTFNIWFIMIDFPDLFQYRFHGVITFSCPKSWILLINHGWLKLIQFVKTF